MAATGVRIVAKGDGGARARRLLRGLELDARDMRPVMGRIATLVHKREAQAFRSRGDRKWPALDPDTILIKRRRGQGRRVLVAQGDLERSLTSPTAQGSLTKVEAHAVTVGTTLPHAHHANRRRPVIRVRPKELRQFQLLIREHLSGGDA